MRVSFEGMISGRTTNDENDFEIIVKIMGECNGQSYIKKTETNKMEKQQKTGRRVSDDGGMSTGLRGAGRQGSGG